MKIQDLLNPEVKRKNRFDKDVLCLLFFWLANDPYPKSQEKAIMAEKTGLRYKQIDLWFVNARRRYLCY